jgi:hypothetical protein
VELKHCPRWRFIVTILAFSAVKFSCVIAAVCLWEGQPGELLRHSVAVGWLIGLALFCGLSIVDMAFARALVSAAVRRRDKV